MVYVIGDLHLGFSTGKPMDRFGEEWNNHHEKIKEDWLSKVCEHDIVLLAGDISWAMRYDEALVDFRWIEELPGKKLIIKGNHDYWWNYKSKLANLYPSVSFLYSNSYEYGRYAFVGTRGWDLPADGDEEAEKIYRRELVRLENSLKTVPKNRVVIGMIHYPPDDKGGSTAFTELFRRYGVKKVYYGHLHSRYGFQNAFEGRLDDADYRLISCDYTGFRLVDVRCGSCLPVDDTDFSDSALLLEERLQHILRLEKKELDKSSFVEANFDLARRIFQNYRSPEQDFEDVSRFDASSLDASSFDDSCSEEFRRLIRAAVDMAQTPVLSVADGLIKYNYINSLAKYRMSEADVFEFSNLGKCLAMRRTAHRLYELKEIVTEGLCDAVLALRDEMPDYFAHFPIRFYKIQMRSEALNGKIYEITAVPDERIVLHTGNENVIRKWKEKGLQESEYRHSVISDYVNTKSY